MGANGELAQNISKTPPWWATAPIWLAAGIVGVPSLMAIGMGYFVASSVTGHLNEIRLTNQMEIGELRTIRSNQEKYWEQVRRTMSAAMEAQVRTCVHQAETKADRDDCVKGLMNEPK